MESILKKYKIGKILIIILVFLVFSLIPVTALAEDKHCLCRVKEMDNTTYYEKVVILSECTTFCGERGTCRQQLESCGIGCKIDECGETAPSRSLCVCCDFNQAVVSLGAMAECENFCQDKLGIARLDSTIVQSEEQCIQKRKPKEEKEEKEERAASTSERGIFTRGLSNKCVSVGACGTCDILVVVNNIIGFALQIVGGLAVLALVISGVLYITSQGNPEQTQHAKMAATAAVIGTIIVLATWLIVTTIVNTLGFNMGSWYAPSC